MTALPTWADNPQSRSLIAAILREQPDCFYVTRYADDTTRYPRYKGFTARALRQLWEDERMAAMDANDRDRWIELGNANPDDLLGRLIAEAEQLTETESDPFLPKEWAA
jgi:hypothetical protein